MGRKIGKLETTFDNHIELNIKIGINNQIWIWTHIIDRGSMITFLYLLACVYCYCKCLWGSQSSS